MSGEHGSSSRRRHKRRKYRRSGSGDADSQLEDGIEQGASRRRRRKHDGRRRGHESADHEEVATDEGSRRWLHIRIAVTAVCGIAGYFLFQTAFAGNATPRTISLMAPLVPVFLVVYLLMTLEYRPKAFFTGLGFVVGSFIFLVHLRQREFDDFTYDWAIIAQLAVVAAAGVWLLVHVRRLVTQWPWNDPIAALLLAFVALSALSLTVSPNPTYGAASVATFIAFFGTAALLCMQLRSGEMQALLALAVLPTITLSLVSYFSQVEMNMAWGMSTDYSVPRLRGVAGTPVGMSNQCFLFLIACFARAVTARQNRAAWLAFGFAAVPLAATVGWLSESRSPPAAFLLTLAVVSVLYFKPFGRHSLLISIVGGLAALPIAYFMIDQGVTDSLLAGLSRSGQAKEISTLTGRLELWEVAVAKIAERPFLGYGFGSGVALVPGYFEGTDFNIVHFHNLAIHTAFSVGVAGSIILTLIIIFSFIRAYQHDDLLSMLLLLYLILTNITETSIIANRPGYYTFVFLLAVCRILILGKPGTSRAATESRSSASRSTRRRKRLAAAEA